VKRKLLVLAVAGLFGGALHASTVVSCSWASTATNSCIQGGLTNFATQLDWAAFGINGAVHTGLWTNTMSGYNVTVSEQNILAGEGARTADNFGSVLYNGTWYDYQSAPIVVPNAFVGHFNSSSTPIVNVPGDYQNIGVPGDHLMGLAANGGGSSNRALVIDFGKVDPNFGFRIAAVQNASFNLTMNIFSGANGTGTLIGTYNFNSLTGGGTCATLRPGTGNTPAACNDAPFIAALNVAAARSISLSTDDLHGFFIGDIYAGQVVPEPTPFLFAGCGLVLLYIGKKRWGRA
jgi:uncharacterized cupin superfamily protein